MTFILALLHVLVRSHREFHRPGCGEFIVCYARFSRRHVVKNAHYRMSGQHAWHRVDPDRLPAAMAVADDGPYAIMAVLRQP